MRTRTARINAVRGHLREFGIAISAGARNVVPQASAALESGVVPGYLRAALEDALDEIRVLKVKRTHCATSSGGSPSRCPKPRYS